jgi:hypothetical protein
LRNAFLISARDGYLPEQKYKLFGMSVYFIMFTSVGYTDNDLGIWTLYAYSTSDLADFSTY